MEKLIPPFPIVVPRSRSYFTAYTTNRTLYQQYLSNGRNFCTLDSWFTNQYKNSCAPLFGHQEHREVIIAFFILLPMIGYVSIFVLIVEKLRRNESLCRLQQSRTCLRALLIGVLAVTWPIWILPLCLFLFPALPLYGCLQLSTAISNEPRRQGGVSLDEENTGSATTLEQPAPVVTAPGIVRASSSVVDPSTARPPVPAASPPDYPHHQPPAYPPPPAYKPFA